MEKIAGAAIFLVGVLIIVFGGTTMAKTDSAKAGPFRLPYWADKAIQWGIGILSVWFGVQLFFGNAHFF
jgi:hypothetical protein